MNKFDVSALWKDFHTRQKLLAVIGVAAVVFAMFYWTNQIISNFRNESAAAAKLTAERIVNVQKRILEINDKNANSKVLTNGLLSYVQDMGANMGIASKFTNIRLVSAQGRQEQVTFRSEGLVYQQLILIVRDLEQYDNVWVKSFMLTKRFDNPKRIDVSWDVIRSVQ